MSAKTVISMREIEEALQFAWNSEREHRARNFELKGRLQKLDDALAVVMVSDEPPDALGWTWFKEQVAAAKSPDCAPPAPYLLSPEEREALASFLAPFNMSWGKGRRGKLLRSALEKLRREA